MASKDTQPNILSSKDSFQPRKSRNNDKIDVFEAYPNFGRKWRMEEIAQAYMVSKMTMEVGRRKDEAQRLN